MMIDSSYIAQTQTQVRKVVTRINVVEPSTLTRQHLLAEYREIVRPFALVRNAQANGVNKINFHKKYKVPSEYTLGAGHVVFHYDKLGYLLKRYNALQGELIKRGYNISPVPNSELVQGIRSEWFGDYVPTAKAIAINVERINKRLSGDKT